jgi:hypothetical protein
VCERERKDRNVQFDGDVNVVEVPTLEVHFSRETEEGWILPVRQTKSGALNH